MTDHMSQVVTLARCLSAELAPCAMSYIVGLNQGRLRVGSIGRDGLCCVGYSVHSIHFSGLVIVLGLRLEALVLALYGL